ncbi:MAG: nitroreductase family protein, partial [Clostridia bacterium]
MYTSAWPINGILSPKDSTALFEAIALRKSCRSFLSAPTTEQWNQLGTAAERFRLPGARIALGLCDTSLFQPFLGLMMKFENVQRYAAIIATDNDPRGTVNAGASGELLLLQAVNMGLAGVWVSGTFKRQKVNVKLADGERLLALIALGVPAEPPQLVTARERKPLTAYYENDFSTAPIVVREMMVAVQAAPSAMNKQPWRTRYEPEGVLVLRVKSPALAGGLDLGIATVHA